MDWALSSDIVQSMCLMSGKLHGGTGLSSSIGRVPVQRLAGCGSASTLH